MAGERIQMQRPVPAHAVRTPGPVQVDAKHRHGSENHIRKPVQPVGKLARDSKQWVIRELTSGSTLCSKNCAYSWSEPGSWRNVDQDAVPSRRRVAGQDLSLKQAALSFIP